MILSNPTNPQSPQFRVLTDPQCAELYHAALECLQRVGIQVHNPAARNLLKRHGATMEDHIVRLPEKLVEQAIQTTPHEYTVWGRDDRYAMQVALDHVHFGPGPTCTYFVDPDTGERRKARRGDAGLTARVCDALPNIDYVMGLSLFDDVTPALSPVYEFAEELENTSKPIVAWANSPESFLDIYQMAIAVAGAESALREKPVFAYFTTYESPLKLANEPLANLMQAAERGIPSVCLGGPTVGLESPFTGASALTLYLASALGALTVVQLHVPGAPMAIGGLPSMMDLRTARPAYGSPEASLHGAAAADLARHLGLPFMGTAGASEAKRVDAQAGVEAALQVMLSALSGASLVHDVGFLDCADIGSLSYLVLADEIIGMTKRVMRGIEVNADTIMLDLIERVGPGGLFLNQARSASLCRKEAWVPSVLDRDPYNIWERKGSQTTEQALTAKLMRILGTHRPAPLAADAQKKISDILRLAEEREVKRQDG
ncbi:MAG TPA: trimethylamine methyltransferase family protein [Anaerolineales bacterium]|nr:trimethylamine methyltransferase family protein [Anaerolineales bacterium]